MQLLLDSQMSSESFLNQNDHLIDINGTTPSKKLTNKVYNT